MTRAQLKERPERWKDIVTLIAGGLFEIAAQLKRIADHLDGR